MKRLALAALAALALPAAPAAAQNWNAEYVETAQGHRVGNPDADLNIIEFVSYTCPHCANFEEVSEAELKYFYIHEGHATLEVRHLIRNVVDIAAALVTECGPDENFFGNHRIMLVEQDVWLPRAQNLTEAQQARWGRGTIPERMRAIADDLGWYELYEPRGYTVTQLDQCLSDVDRANALAAASSVNAQEFGVQGTPSFVLNGELLDGVHDWPALSQVLLAARETPLEATE